MMSPNLVDYEILLLLAKHSEKQVISALARNLGVPIEEIEKRLEGLRQLKPRIRPRSRVDPQRTINALGAKHPEKASCLEALFRRFQNKTFLPQVSDVRRFFRRYSNNSVRVRSRDAPVLRLFRLLASLDLKELQSFLQEPEETKRSSLGILCDEILRGTKPTAEES